jgi:hypothetical protein
MEVTANLVINYELQYEIKYLHMTYDNCSLEQK